MVIQAEDINMLLGCIMTTYPFVVLVDFMNQTMSLNMVSEGCTYH